MMPRYQFDRFEIDSTRVRITEGFVDVIWPEHTGGLGRWTVEVRAAALPALRTRAAHTPFELTMESDENGFRGSAYMIEAMNGRLLFRGHGPLGAFHVPLTASIEGQE